MATDPAPDETALALARSVAADAAVSAGVEIRPAASADDAQAARDVLDAVFLPAPGEHEASVELLCAFAHAGQYLVLAHDAADDRPLATSVGFFHEPAQHTLHSHATAVVEGARGRHLGRAVKLHQRAWAMQRGVTTVTWTFDPLVRRNAWFNLARLGALPTAFRPRFYGEMTDGVNAGDESDRFVVTWDLVAPRVTAACGGESVALPAIRLVADEVPALLSVGPGDEPARAGLPAGAASALVQVPADVEKLRLADPALALRWRRELRGALTQAGDAGLAVAGIGADGWYVLERQQG